MDDRNLYAPPTAAVADPVETRGKRPREITWAIILVWAWAATYLASDLPSIAVEFINGSIDVFYILGWLIGPVGIPAAAIAWITDRIQRHQRPPADLPDCPTHVGCGHGDTAVHSASQ